MKGCIGRHGHLFILRGKRMKPMNCPVSQGEMLCGDWCPQFGKPKEKGKGATLSICFGKILEFRIFEDDRME